MNINPLTAALGGLLVGGVIAEALDDIFALVGASWGAFGGAFGLLLAAVDALVGG